MKKNFTAFLLVFALLLSACGAVGPFTDEPCTAEEEPAPSPTRGLIEQSFGENESTQSLECSYGFAGVALSLPEDWNYEIVEWSEEAPEFGIDFWPSGSGEGRLRLRCYCGTFGVCGTGLTEAEDELPGTGKLRIGYYDGQAQPSFISFYDSPGGWVLLNELGSGWSAHETEIEKILSSLVLDGDIIRVSRAEEIALSSLALDYDYLRTDFNMESGELTVSFAKYGGKSNGELRLDGQGNILE